MPNTRNQNTKIVDSYLGTDNLLNAYVLIKEGLMKVGFSEKKANSYAWFCEAIYKELKDQHDVIDGLHKIASANQILPKAIPMNLTRSIYDYRRSAGVAVLAPFINRFAAIARLNGIELNECSLSVAEVALDIAGAGVGTVSSVSGIGIPLLFLSVLSTFNDSYDLGRACSS